MNGEIENIGARRLQTVMEKLLEEVSFDAEDRQGETLTIDAAYVEEQLAAIAREHRSQPLRAVRRQPDPSCRTGSGIHRIEGGADRIRLRDD